MEAEEFMKLFDSCWFGSPKIEPPSTAMLMLFKINQSDDQTVNKIGEKQKCFSPSKKHGCSCRRDRRKGLSRMEFEEVKGFMDLGFVFDDKHSGSVSIIPGMKKMANEDKKGLLMNWKMPITKNDITMKDHLRFWARIVASNVK